MSDSDIKPTDPDTSDKAEDPQTQTAIHCRHSPTARSHFSLLAMVLIALTASFGALSMSTPAQAAGSTSLPDVYGCFVWSNGYQYKAYPVQLRAWYPATATRQEHWGTARTVNTNSYGCVRFNDVATGKYYELYTHWGYVGTCTVYYGESNYVRTAAGDTLYRMGTTTVSEYSIC